MINIQGKLPRDLVVATSGGVDSMVAVDFLSRNHNVTMQFVHHKTDTSQEACEFLQKYARYTNKELIIDYIEGEKVDRQSQEEFWRDERYKIFEKWNLPVITCHHLDDCVETWIWSCLNGEGKIIPYRRENVIRPFRLNTKDDFYDWASRQYVSWVEDKSNADTKYMRNFIRHELLPKALIVNPGLHKVIRKKIVKEELT